MSEFIRLQANGVDAYPDASTENTYRSNGTSVESALLALESNVNTLGGVAGEAKTLAEQNSVKIATAEQEISDINSSLNNMEIATVKVILANTSTIVSRVDYPSGFNKDNCYVSSTIIDYSNINYINETQVEVSLRDVIHVDNRNSNLVGCQCTVVLQKLPI